MPICLIHIDDEPMDLLFTGSRWKKAGGMHAHQVQVHNDRHSSREDVAEIVHTMIQTAARDGRQLLLCSDYSIGGVYGTSDRLWAVVWERLTAHERESVVHFVIRCTTDGVEPLRRAVEGLPGFAARVHSLPKESVDVIALGKFFYSLLQPA